MGEGEAPIDMGEGATGGREGATCAGEDPMGMGGGDVQEHMLVYMQTQLTVAEAHVEEMEVEVAARDVQWFARESELIVVLQERDDVVERLRELQDRG